MWFPVSKDALHLRGKVPFLCALQGSFPMLMRMRLPAESRTENLKIRRSTECKHCSRKTHRTIDSPTLGPALEYPSRLRDFYATQQSSFMEFIPKSVPAPLLSGAIHGRPPSMKCNHCVDSQDSGADEAPVFPRPGIMGRAVIIDGKNLESLHNCCIQVGSLAALVNVDSEPRHQKTRNTRCVAIVSHKTFAVESTEPLLGKTSWPPASYPRG